MRGYDLPVSEGLCPKSRTFRAKPCLRCLPTNRHSHCHQPSSFPLPPTVIPTATNRHHSRCHQPSFPLPPTVIPAATNRHPRYLPPVIPANAGIHLSRFRCTSPTTSNYLPRSTQSSTNRHSHCHQPSFPRTRESTSADFVVQVQPLRIIFLDQLNLPRASPLLERLFSSYGAFHRSVNLIPDKTVNTVALRESFHEVILMLPDTLDEIRCYTDVQCAIRFTRKDVNARVCMCGPMDSRVRGNDGWLVGVGAESHNSSLLSTHS